uniref:Dynein heavy chain coiled coil stalk domain-containing protein n=1 Tax=Ditylenchus dipsaci TaxID=166011 RepID=A0A915EJK1_9BILA
MWRETLTKIVRLCVVEKRRIVLHVSDHIFHKPTLEMVLSDLIVVLNRGGLPTRLFSQQLLNELNEQRQQQIELLGDAKAHINSNNISSEWTQRQVLSKDIRKNLHVVFSADPATVKKFEHKFQQIFNYVLIDNLDIWSKPELVSYATSQLYSSQQFTHKSQIDQMVRKLLSIHKKLGKIRPHSFTHINFLNYKELLRLQPELVRTSLETTVLMSTIERETIEIENAREVVAANEFKANEAATKAQALKVECEQDLAEAIPTLEAAIDALKILNQSDISILKTMRFPPQGVRICMEAVCLLLGEKPARFVDSNGNHVVDFWVTSQKVLADIHFLQRIRNFPRDKVSNKVIRHIRRKYLCLTEFDAENIRSTSLAAEGLCLWVKAIDAYNRISKVVEPKKEKLKKAELMIKQHMKQLDIKRKALQEVTERLQGLSDQFGQMSQRKQELQNQIQACETKMSRSHKLLTALKSEQSRWNKNVGDLSKQNSTYVQQAMVGAALVEYLGNLDYTFRKIKGDIATIALY